MGDSNRESGQGETAVGRQAGPRCIALVGPFASGKTSLLEAILARTGAISRQGRSADGNMVGDASPEARAHQMSVEANFSEINYMGDSFTFIDCPGSVEFMAESDGVLGGCDVAVVVAEPDDKKIPALQLIFKRLEERGIPRMLFLNKIDRTDRRVREVLAALQPASSVPLVLRQIPIWNDGAAVGYIDLALERAFVYREQAPSEVIDLKGEDQEREMEARFSMLESLSDYDDALMEALLEDRQPAHDQVFGDLVEEMRLGDICPVFIGSAEHGNGIFRLLKALRHEAPDIRATRARLGLGEGVEAVQILKTLNTAYAGKLSVARVLSGSVSDGSILFREDGSEEKVSGLYGLNGQQASKRATAETGETVGLGKLDKAITGETLGIGQVPAKQLYALKIQEPVLELSIRASEHKDDVKLSSALQKLSEEDPSYRITQDQESGETLLGGQGEMHLRVAQERLKGRYSLSLEVRPHAVPYRETIRAKTSVRGRHKKQSGGHGQFGDTVLKIEPLPRGEGIVFTDTITGGVVPKQYIPAVGEGVREALKVGTLGFPVVDVQVTLTDGSFHSVDSSDQAFKMAAILGIREGLPQCKPVLLEPFYEVTVVCPSEATAKMNAILSARRGQLLGFDGREGWSGWDEVRALMPEADIEDLIIELRSASAGVGTFFKRFSHLAELEGKAAEHVLERCGKKAA